MSLSTRQFTFYTVLLGVLAAFGQPLAGLFYHSNSIFLSIYAIRESWLIVASYLIVVLIARTACGNQHSVVGGFSVVIYITIVLFILLVGITERSPSGMIVFLQFRNIFGFALAIILMDRCRGRFDAEILDRAAKIIAVAIIAYSYAELFGLIKFGQLMSNEIFNKELLEQAKGTRADVGGGLFGYFRIPGPLFNPSQLGMFCVYLIYAGLNRPVSFGKTIVVLLVGIVIIGFSKSALVMLLMLIPLRVFGRQLSLFVLIGFLFSPFILEFLVNILPEYHYASIARHFEGYVSALHVLEKHPLGTGVGSAGELASTLGGFEAGAGFESGMGTILMNLGTIGLLFYFLVGAFCFAQRERVYFDLFTLWSVSMYFNESAMSPHLFIFQFCVVGASLAKKRIDPRHADNLGQSRSAEVGVT